MLIRLLPSWAILLMANLLNRVGREDASRGWANALHQRCLVTLRGRGTPWRG